MTRINQPGKQQKRVVIATCQEFYQHGRSQLSDDVALCERLHQLGIEAEVVPWDMQPYNWGRATAVVIRSTYYYHHRPLQFLSWAEQVAHETILLNPIEAIRWNMHKAVYLLALQELGFPLIPTIVLPDHRPVDLTTVIMQQGWQRAVLKPGIGANSYNTYLLDSAQDLVDAQSYLTKTLQPVLLQPYMESVATRGEINHVIIEKQWSHSFWRERPFRIQGPQDLAHEPIFFSPPQEEVLLAESVLQAIEQLLGVDLLFGRVDLVQDDGGQPCIMEVELMDASLHLGEAGRLDRMAQALAARLCHVAVV